MGASGSNFRVSVFVFLGAFALLSLMVKPTAAERLGFVLVPGAASDISIGGGQVWTVNKSSKAVQKWNNAARRWDAASGKKAVRVDVDADGNPIIVTDKSELFFRVGNQWRGLGIGGRDVAATKYRTYLTGFDYTDVANRRKELQRLTQRLDSPLGSIRGPIRGTVRNTTTNWFARGAAAEIDAHTANKDLWTVDTKGKITHYPGGASIKNISGSAKDIVVSAGGDVWIIDGQNRLAKRNGSSWQVHDSNAKLVRLAIDGRGLLWGLDASGRVYADHRSNLYSSKSAAAQPRPSNQNSGNQNQNQPQSGGASQNQPTTQTAQNRQDPMVTRMLKSKRCKKCNLSGKDLRNLNLTKVDLSGADLSGALLNDATLTDTKFVGATMNRTDLRKATGLRTDFTKAKLREGKFQEASLIGAKFVGAQMHDAHLEKATLDKAQFGLEQATHADHKANMFRAHLQGASLKKARLHNASLIEADLRDAKMHEAHLISSDFTRADLRKANLTGAFVNGADFRRAKTQGIILNRLNGGSLAK